MYVWNNTTTYWLIHWQFFKKYIYIEEQKHIQLCSLHVLVSLYCSFPDFQFLFLIIYPGSSFLCYGSWFSILYFLNSNSWFSFPVFHFKKALMSMLPALIKLTAYNLLTWFKYAKYSPVRLLPSLINAPPKNMEWDSM